jgi:hypothetical protein
MANIMSVRLSIINLSPNSFNELMSLLIFKENSDLYVNETEHLKKLFGIETIDYEKVVELVGAKWINIELPSTNFNNTVDLFIETAWSVPFNWLETLTEVLTNIDNDIILKGFFQDESLSPMGAFVFAKNYDNIENLDIEIDTDLWWDDDQYQEKIYKQQEDLLEGLLVDFNSLKK